MAQTARRQRELDGNLGDMQAGEPDVHAVTRDRTADCLLAYLFEVAMEVFNRIRRRAPFGVAADGAGVLYPGRDRSP